MRNFVPAIYCTVPAKAKVMSTETIAKIKIKFPEKSLHFFIFSSSGHAHGSDGGL